jgi:O-antigen ligase
MIAVLQHRTVWVVAAVYLGLTALRKGAYRRHAIVSLGLMVLLGSVIGLGLLGENLRDSMLTSVEEPFRSNASTIAWRVEGWRMLLGGQDRLNVLDFIVGAPLGTRFLRLVFGSWVDVTPHNYYLQTYLRVGLVGLASLLVMYGTMIASLQRAGRQLATKDDAFWLLSVLLVGQLVFFVTYGPNYEQGILLGAALAMCVRMPRRDIRTSREGSESWLPAPSSPS